MSELVWEALSDVLSLMCGQTIEVEAETHFSVSNAEVCRWLLRDGERIGRVGVERWLKRTELERGERVGDMVRWIREDSWPSVRPYCPACSFQEEIAREIDREVLESLLKAVS